MLIGDHELYRFVLPLMTSNMYVMLSGDKGLVIDPLVSPEAEKLLREHDIKELLIILTHEHFDHISGVNSLRALMAGQKESRGCKVLASAGCAEAIKDPAENLSAFFSAVFIKHSEEERLLARTIFDKTYCCEADDNFHEETEVHWEELTLRLKATPGHSPGSICIEIYDTNGNLIALATGDSLVQGNKVITRLPGGDRKAYNSITRPYLESFDGDTLVLPGHGETDFIKNLELG